MVSPVKLLACTYRPNTQQTAICPQGVQVLTWPAVAAGINARAVERTSEEDQRYMVRHSTCLSVAGCLDGSGSVQLQLCISCL